MRIMSWYTTGDDVAALQKALIARGVLAVPADGRYDWRTRTAVAAFQAGSGLAVDGVAGPQTQAALGLADDPVPTGGGGPGQGRSLHIGLNAVNPAAYAGWPGTLKGCENDAKSMLRIAQQEGFQPGFLLTAAATSQALFAALQDAASTLTAGDTFWLTYSGHGGQVPSATESDGRDETWVLYDRMVTDDELAAAFSRFEAGVNIVMVSDSCHSGTVFRAQGRVIPAEVLQLVLASGAGASLARPVAVAANGIALNACQDDQLAQEIGGAGVFTTQIIKTWSGGGYVGGYDTFLQRIVAAMPKDQTPQFGEFGADPASLKTRTPFKLSASSGRQVVARDVPIAAYAAQP